VTRGRYGTEVASISRPFWRFVAIVRSLASLSAGLGGIAFLLAGSPVSAQATVPSHGAASAALTKRTTRPHVRRKNLAQLTTCSTVASDGFIALTGESNYVGPDSAVLGGSFDTACDTSDGILAGQRNEIGGGGYAYLSAIGAGIENAITGSNDMIGAGYRNSIDRDDAFVGSGELNDASGTGAVVVGGDTIYADSGGLLGSSDGNVASGTDSFVGAGDLNLVSGQGAFIGAGGSSYAATRASPPGNQVSGTDSFIGAGDQNYVTGSWAFVGGGVANRVYGSGSFIGGGGYLNSKGGDSSNFIAGADGFIGAGDLNSIVSNGAFIGGGLSNSITVGGTDAAIAGGDHNTVSGAYAAVAGGYHNNATAAAAAVGGGSSSSATGTYATIPGGYLNAASGIGSFAAGTQAKARHNGAFVWSDNNGTAPVQSTAPYQFVARASGGFYLFSNASETAGVRLNAGSGAWASLSDRSMKTGVLAIDDAAVLAKVAALPVNEWSYTSEHGVRHVGPMAQDFYAAFGVGEDDRHITSIDEDGVALAAIKALAAQTHGLQTKTRALDAENHEIHQENDGMKADNRELRRETAGLRARLTRQDARVAALEREVAALVAR